MMLDRWSPSPGGGSPCGGDWGSGAPSKGGVRGVGRRLLYLPRRPSVSLDFSRRRFHSPLPLALMCLLLGTGGSTLWCCCCDAFRPAAAPVFNPHVSFVSGSADRRAASVSSPFHPSTTTTATTARRRREATTGLSLSMLPEVQQERKKQQPQRPSGGSVDRKAVTKGASAPEGDDRHHLVDRDSHEADRIARADTRTLDGGGVHSRSGLYTTNDGSAPLDPRSSAGIKVSDDGLGIWAARALLLLVAAIWGTNFASVKYLEGLCFHPPCHHPASEFAFARFGVAALVSLPLLWRQNARVVLAGFECGLTITLGYISQAMALETIPSGECAFICSLTVVVVPLAAALLYGKPLELRHLAAAAVALLGVGILEGLIDVTSWFSAFSGTVDTAANSIAVADSTSALAAAASSVATTVAESAPAAGTALNTVAHSYGPLDGVAKALHVETGDLLALGQPLGFGYSFLRIEHYQEQFKDVPNRVLTIAAAQCVCVGILAALWMLSDYHFVVPSFGYLVEPHRIAVILWTGIVTTLLAIYLEGFALQTASATDASIAFSSEPVWASLFGFWLLREQLGVESYIGGTVIMAACLIGTLSDGGKKQQQEPALEAVDVSSLSPSPPSTTARWEGRDADDDPTHAP